MTSARPILGDLTLESVQRIETEEGQALERHEVPALEGDFLQRLGRRGTRVALAGVVTGPGSADRLAELRAKVRRAEPVCFVSDVATATRLREVMVEELDVREVAGKPERFEVAVALRELTEPPAAESGVEEVPGAEDTAAVEQAVEEEGEQEAEETVAQISGDLGVLRVRVESDVEGANLANLVVLVEGTTAGGEAVSLLLEEPVEGVFTKTDMPAGDYVVKVQRR
jgi:hypothetical protein